MITLTAEDKRKLLESGAIKPPESPQAPAVTPVVPEPAVLIKDSRPNHKSRGPGRKAAMELIHKLILKRRDTVTANMDWQANSRHSAMADAYNECLLIIETVQEIQVP